MNRASYYLTRAAYRQAVHDDTARSLSDMRDANDCYRDRPGQWWPTTERERAVLAPLSPRDRAAVTSKDYGRPARRLPMGPRAEHLYRVGRVLPGQPVREMNLNKRIALRSALAKIAAYEASRQVQS